MKLEIYKKFTPTFILPPQGGGNEKRVILPSRGGNGRRSNLSLKGRKQKKSQSFSRWGGNKIIGNPYINWEEISGFNPSFMGKKMRCG